MEQRHGRRNASHGGAKRNQSKVSKTTVASEEPPDPWAASAQASAQAKPAEKVSSADTESWEKPASPPDSFEGEHGDPSGAVGRNGKKNQEEVKAADRDGEDHDKRSDRREPKWNGDSEDRWRNGRKKSSGGGDGDGEGHDDGSSGDDSSRRDRRRRKKDKRRRPRRDPSSSPSSSSSESSSSSSRRSSSSDDRKARRKNRGSRKVDHSKNVKIPAFDGTNNKYRDYRRQVKRYTQLVGKEGTGLALQLNLSGEALEVTRHLKPRKLKAKGGVRLLLDALDDEYRGMEEDRLDEAAEAFIQCRKLANEPMSRYIRRLRQVRRELEEEDENMYVSEKFFSWLLLRKSGLSSEEKSRVRSAAHCSEHSKDLSYALKRLFPSIPYFRPNERRRDLRTIREDRPSNFKSAMVTEEANHPERNEESDPEEIDSASETSDEDGGSEPGDVQSPPVPEQEVLAAMQTVRRAEKQGHDVYALYKSAKHQQRDGKKKRGFFRGPQGQSREEREKQIAAAKANSECRACHQRGHWEGDEVCPKYDPNKPKRKGRVRDVNMVEFELEHEYVMNEALVFATTASKREGFRCEEAVGITDSGCQQTVMGLIPFVAWEKCLKEDALIREPLSRQTSDSVFKFGNNGRLKALFAAEVPIWLYGKKAFLFVTIVAGQTPLLLSRHTLRSMHASIDFSAGVITSGQLGVDHEPIKEVGGHLALDLMNTDSCPNVVAYMSDSHCQQTTDQNLNCSDDSNVVFHEDCWCWVSAAVFRRDHVVPRCCRFHPNDADEMNELDIDTWTPFCIQISRCEGQPTCEVTMFSWKSLTKSNSSSDSFWIGETWFWIESVNKREVFREILKHSSMGVTAPLLRSAWKRFFALPSPDGHGSALPYVLEPGSESLSLGEERARIHSQGESRSTSGPSSSSAGVFIQAGGEVDGHRTSSDLQVRGEGQTASSGSNTILQHQAQGRADGDDQGPSDCDSPRAEGEQGRADVDASSTLA